MSSINLFESFLTGLYEWSLVASIHRLIMWLASPSSNNNNHDHNNNHNNNHNNQLLWRHQARGLWHHHGWECDWLSEELVSRRVSGKHKDSIKTSSKSPRPYQDRCAVTPGCLFWTWYPDQGHCWLLTDCDNLETCPACISGPGQGVDVDNCV